MAQNALVLGVDGGGTKTVALVADQIGNILTRREVGPTNPNVVGFDAAVKHLYQVIFDCCKDVRCTPEELRNVVLALAGAGRAESRRRLNEGLNGLFQKAGFKNPPVTIETDARAALEGAFDGAAGVVVIAGTGSVVIGKTDRGEIVTIGGWGRVLGDEGSGYDIGREALKVLTHHLDHRAEAGKLWNALTLKYPLSSREDIIAAVYQEGIDIAALARVVVDSAADNDITSQKILQHAANQLAEQIRVVVLRMGILRKVGLVFCGGLIDHETVYANVLHMKILKILPQVEIRSAMHSPAHGAVFMALDRLRKS